MHTTDWFSNYVAGLRYTFENEYGSKDYAMSFTSSDFGKMLLVQVNMAFSDRIYSLGVRIDRKLFDDDRFDDIRRVMENLAKAAFRTKEKVELKVPRDEIKEYIDRESRWQGVSL